MEASGYVSNIGRYLQVYTALLTAAVTFYDYPEVDPNLRPINVPTSDLLPEYDFIIVGSGSAGAPLARRLTEIPHWTVLLLEAGGDETVETDTPMFAYNIRGTNVDWNYTTVPQKNVCQGTGGVCAQPRGRVIGGSSTLNDFVFVRGNRQDYDGWAAQGNTEWSYRQVLPYFIRLENVTDPSIIDSPYHGRGGPITIGISPFLTEMVPYYLGACRDMGLTELDVDGESQVGYMVTRGPIIEGMRCSNGRGYLRPIRNRTNLHVAEDALVTKVNIDPRTKTATGVTFVRYGRTVQVRARKEVILSAGAVGSPQLLMLSGIGPAEHLEELGIPVIEDLKVGDNLQDHLASRTPLTQSSGDYDFNVKNVYTIPNLLQYATNRTGVLTSLGGSEVGGDIYDEYPPRVPGLPDISFEISTYLPSSINDQVFYTTTYPLRPTSKGTIRLANTDPTAPPLIDPQYLTTEYDRQQVLKSAKVAFDFLQTESFRKIGARFYSRYAGPCQLTGNVTEEFLQCLVEYNSYPNYHLCCTCKMGPASDREAVVDSRLRVRNITGLRVVDASIIPTIVSGNLNAPVIMIGERASDLIREDYGESIGRIPPIPSSA